MANQFGEDYKFDGDLTSKNGIVIDVKDLIEYYITENHSKKETIEHFGVNGSFISTIIRHYNIKKSRQLSHEHNKKTSKRLYGDENYNNKEKFRQTCLERYGVENVFQSEDTKKKCEQTKLEKYGDAHFINLEKAKQTCLERYGHEFAFQSESVKEKSRQTCLDRFGAPYPMQSEEVKSKYDYEEIAEKVFDTKKKNGTTNTSKIQQWFINQMIEIYGADDVKTEYKEERYPYHCDVYIPSKDLFIELNLFFTHGGHPYSDSEEDKIKLESWIKKSETSRFMKNAITVWTQSDPAKRECAKRNNLNYLMFYTEEEAKKYVEDLRKESKQC